MGDLIPRGRKNDRSIYRIVASKAAPNQAWPAGCSAAPVSAGLVKHYSPGNIRLPRRVTAVRCGKERDHFFLTESHEAYK